MSSAAIFAQVPERVRILKNILSVDENFYVMALSADPTSVATDAPIGSIGAFGNLLYKKEDNGLTTNWTLIIDSGSASSIPQLSPVGSITAWIGGYFTNGVNGGYTPVLSLNTVAAVNAFLPAQWRVADGSALNDPASPIWNAAGRFLPNLTSSIFLMGNTTAGGLGGSNTNSHTHSFSTPDHSHAAGGPAPNGLYLRQYFRLNLGAPFTTDYEISVYPAYSVGQRFDFGTLAASSNTPGFYANTNAHEVLGTTGLAGASASNTGAASDTNNIPNKIDVFYIVRVK